MTTSNRPIQDWQKIVGDGHCQVSASHLSSAGTATFATQNEVDAIVSPGSVSEVAAVVACANQHGAPLYPISRGRNWGLGSRVPTAPNCAILDLSRLDAITHFDGELGTLRIQPGVTFQQVYAFLIENKANYYLAAMGGPADASVLANTLERGDGIGPGGNRFAEAYDYEVVLASGEIIRTGVSEWANLPVAALHGTGVGPVSHGLFSQSNLGIVTGMTVVLTPKPALAISTLVDIGGAEALSGFVEAARPLLRQGLFEGYAMTIWNGCKMMARDHNVLSLPKEKNTTENLDAWYATVHFYAESEAAMNIKIAGLKGGLEGQIKGMRLFRDKNEKGHQVPTPFTGQPSNRNLRSVYWRKPEFPGNDMNPDRDRCGAIWVCPAVPFRGEDVAQAKQIMTDIVIEHGFESNLGFHAISFRCFNAFLALVYDRDVVGEDEKAMACHDAVMAALLKAGYIPYRLGLQSMDVLPPPSPLQVALKQALDPKGIIAPGRYGP